MRACAKVHNPSAPSGRLPVQGRQTQVCALGPSPFRGGKRADFARFRRSDPRGRPASLLASPRAAAWVAPTPGTHCSARLSSDHLRVFIAGSASGDWQPRASRQSPRAAALLPLSVYFLEGRVPSLKARRFPAEFLTISSLCTDSKFRSMLVVELPHFHLIIHSLFCDVNLLFSIFHKIIHRC